MVRRASLLAMLFASPALAQDAPLPPPSAVDRAVTARVVVADYRYGDILWENDRTAHRIYARALEAVEPPSGSGIDSWGKSVRWPFMDRQLRTGKTHDNHGEGVDFYNVRGSRGAGGLGIWHDNKLWVSRNYARVRIIQNGPAIADFSVDYAPWPVDVGRHVSETRRFTLPAGTHFTRMISTLSSNTAASLTVGIGIAKRATSDTALGSFEANRATGRFTWWGPADPAKGSMAVALMVDPAAIAGVTEDADNYLVLLTVRPGKPFVYYSGSAWSGGGDIRTRDDWRRHVAGQSPDFQASAVTR